MMENVVKEFFDGKASNWDKLENKTQTWLNDFIIQHVPLRPHINVLDLGCGTGIISEIIYTQTNQLVKAMDLSTNMVKIAKEKHNPDHIEFVVDDFYHADVSKMDMILCFNAYPHFVDISSFVSKAYHVLNDNGLLVILHSLSRKDLLRCHQGLSTEISRNLKHADEEAKPYLNHFDVLETIDNDEMFKLILKKK